jgi:MFS family permease
MGKPSNFELYFSLLYTVYSVPNCVLPFFGGFFVDKLGVRLCLLAFATFIALGQVVFSFGVSIENWPLMFLGRVLFGIGGESLAVRYNIYLFIN